MNFGDNEIEEVMLNSAMDYQTHWNQMNRPPFNIQPTGVLNENTGTPWCKDDNSITNLYRCEASNAKALCIFDCAHKLHQKDQYDIGGGYADGGVGLWFFFTSSCGPGHIYLLNLFVCQRKPGVFLMGISDKKTLTTTEYNKENVRMLDNKLVFQKFNSSQPDEIHYIKTFHFTEEDCVSMLNMILVIPISIEFSPKNVLLEHRVQNIKAEFDFGRNLFKDVEPDVVIMSSEGKEFKTHKLVLAAHSAKLRDLMRAEAGNTLNLNITNYEIEMLLQYLYTGTIEDILKQRRDVLLKIADQFELKDLLEIAQHAALS